jgi:hypothetical protein
MKIMNQCLRLSEIWFLHEPSAAASAVWIGRTTNKFPTRIAASACLTIAKCATRERAPLRSFGINVGLGRN